MASESHNQILKGLLHLNDGKCPEVKGLVLGPEGQWVEALVNKGHHILPDRSMAGLKPSAPPNVSRNQNGP